MPLSPVQKATRLFLSKAVHRTQPDPCLGAKVENTRMSLIPLIIAWLLLLSSSAPSAAELMDTDPIQDFVEAITDRKLVDHYEKDQLLSAIDVFNHAQNAHFNVDPDHPLPPKGHHSIELEDTGDLFILHFTVAEKSHSDGIDGGHDVYRSVVFDKHSLQQVSELIGPIFGTDPSTTLRVVAPGKTNCLGYELEGKYFVRDIRNGKEYFSGNLPDGTFDFQVTPRNNGRIFSIRSTSQTIVSNPKKEDKCELPYWSKFTEYKTELHCDSKKNKCIKRREAIKRSEGCSHIGGCD